MRTEYRKQRIEALLKAKAALAAVPPAPPPPPSPVVDEPDEEGLPELASREDTEGAAAPPSLAIVQLGSPTGSVRSMAEWSYQLVMTMAYEAANDPTVSAARREIRVRALLATAARSYPDALRQEAAREIKQSRSKIEDRRRANRAAASLAPRAAPVEGSANVIQFRGTRG